MPDLYSNFLSRTYDLINNFVCASCGVVEHEQTLVHTISMTDQSLQILISRDVYVSFDFATGYSDLNSDHIMIEKVDVVDDRMLLLCHSCHKSIIAGRISNTSLSNYRWIGDQPEEL